MTLTEAEERAWRRLLAAHHPDHGGDAELFKFASNLRDEMRAAYKPPVKQEVKVQTTGNIPLDMWILYLRMWSK
jgi:hypothetical protein